MLDITQTVIDDKHEIEELKRRMRNASTSMIEAMDKYIKEITRIRIEYEKAMTKAGYNKQDFEISVTKIGKQF